MRKNAPTSVDVARLAGVSQSTVSYVLTGSRPISEGTRRRVEEAIDALGYHPNSGARALRSRRSGVIGLLVPSGGDDAILTTFIGAISRCAQTAGYDVLLVTAQEGGRGISRVARTGVCDGLILMEVDRYDERVEAAAQAELPFVLLGNPEEHGPGSVVDLDFGRLGEMVLEHAVREGCKQLLLYGGPAGKRHRNDVSRFLEGVERAQGQLGSRAVRILDDSGPLHAVAENAAAHAERGGRTALFGLGRPNEVLFALALGGMLQREDLHLVALTGQDLPAISPALATVPRIDPRREEISEMVVAELLRLLGDEQAQPRTRLVPPAWHEDCPAD